MHAIADSWGGVQGMLTYYDNRLGRTRDERRYVWAVWAFVGGIVLGVVVGHLI